MKMTVNLTPAEVEDILREYLSKNFKTIGKIELEVKEQLMGNQMHEYYTTVFKGATVEVEM